MMKSPFTRILIAQFLQGCYFFFPIFALWYGNHGVTVAQIIIAQTCYSIFSFLGEIPTGLFADKFGQKLSVIVGMMIEALGVFMIFLFPTTLGIFIAYSTRGFAGSFLSGAEEAWAYELAKKHDRDYAKLRSRMFSISLIGNAIASGAAGIIFQVFGPASFPWLIIATVVFLLVTTLILITVPDPLLDVPNENPASLDELISSTWRVLKNSRIVRAIVIVLVFSLSGEYFLNSVDQGIFRDRSVMPIWFGFVLSIGAFGNAAFTEFISRIRKKVPFATLQTIITLSIGMLFLIFALIPSATMSVISVILLFCLFNSTSPLISNYVNQEIESRNRSTVISAISFVRTGAQIGMRILLGVLLGIWSPIWVIALFGIYLIIGSGIGYWKLRDCGCTD